MVLFNPMLVSILGQPKNKVILFLSHKGLSKCANILFKPELGQIPQYQSNCSSSKETHFNPYVWEKRVRKPASKQAPCFNCGLYILEVNTKATYALTQIWWHICHPQKSPFVTKLFHTIAIFSAITLYCKDGDIGKEEKRFWQKRSKETNTVKNEWKKSDRNMKICLY